MQCKDIPDAPILRLLADLPGNVTATWFGPEYANSVNSAMPTDVPPKLVRAKMGQMIRRGVVDGCACGCHGSFKITQKGRDELALILKRVVGIFPLSPESMKIMSETMPPLGTVGARWNAAWQSLGQYGRLK